MNIKYPLISSILLLLSFQLAFSQTSLPVIKAGSTKVDIRDGEKLTKGKWNISPKAKPDIYSTLVKGSKKITFYTDADSISFNVAAKHNYDFIILLNGKDTCWTRIEAREDVPAVSFSKAYIRRNKGKYSFEIPEVQELVHIVIALGPRGIRDSNMVNHSTSYYQEVMKHFGKYSKEPVVMEIDKIVNGGSYSHVKMDACGFYFEGDQLMKDRVYDRLNWGERNYVEPLQQELQAFALKSGFRTFYKAHQSYYNSLTALLNKQIPLQTQWKWLEANFPNRYENYRVTFSPLVKGSHSANHFETPEFKQAMMFVAGPAEQSSNNETLTEALMSRQVFTEIDHNYVNPISDKYLAEINSAFNDRELWTVKGPSTNGYSSPYLVFNEYMTWAVFTLYAYDHFSPEDFKVINAQVEERMVNYRGFKHFGAYNKKMLALYQQKPKGQQITELYPEMLKWAAEQQN